MSRAPRSATRGARALLMVCALCLGVAQPLQGQDDVLPATRVPVDEGDQGPQVCGCSALQREHAHVLQRLQDTTWARDLWQQRAQLAEAVVSKMPGRKLRYKAQHEKMLREFMQRFREGGRSNEAKIVLASAAEAKSDLREALAAVGVGVLLLQVSYALIMLLPMPSKLGGREIRRVMRSLLASKLRMASMQTVLKALMIGDALMCLESLYVVRTRTAPEQSAQRKLAVRGCTIYALQFCLFGFFVCTYFWRKMSGKHHRARRKSQATRDDGHVKNMYTIGITNGTPKARARNFMFKHSSMKIAGAGSDSGGESPLECGTASGAGSPFRRTLSSPGSPLSRTRSVHDTSGATPPQGPTSWRLVQDVFEIARDTATEVVQFARTGSHDSVSPHTAAPVPSPFGKTLPRSPSFVRTTSNSSVGLTPSLGKSPSSDSFANAMARLPSIERAPSVESVHVAFDRLLGETNHLNNEARRKWYINYSGKREMLQNDTSSVLGPRNPADRFIRNFGVLLKGAAYLIFSPQLGGS